ncbi:hypothetical protein [Actomonas aquatica]|uniref:Uncharacterized protein n=1 Tax=Actomonas aquatica TaxID=2866162 RepID=A0ABZ1C563_9BACT|nr:hypothetical protein [Opitutus sp. WL0086]WRQ86626.1 hypothetical protein K1X11_017580 [Opitutus sp. WL0086]
MAKKITPLSFRDIVLGAEADVIRQALAARESIDGLIVERQAAYERIAALEAQVEDVLGETGAFPFPAPPLPVAGFDPKAATVTRGAAAIRKAEEVLSDGDESTDDADTDVDADDEIEADDEVAEDGDDDTESKA